MLTKIDITSCDWEIVDEPQINTYDAVIKLIINYLIVEQKSRVEDTSFREMAHQFIVRNPEVPVEGVQFYLELKGLEKSQASIIAHDTYQRFLIFHV